MPYKVNQTLPAAFDSKNKCSPNTVIFWESASLTDNFINSFTKGGLSIVVINENNKIVAFHKASTKSG